MTSKNFDNVLNKMSMMISSPMADIISSLIGEIITDKDILEGETSIEKIKDKSNVEDVSLQLLKERVRVAQEIAIALRIETADEVEIEEFYDNYKDINAGLKGNSEGVTFGVNGTGKRVVKRVYKFKGYNNQDVEIYKQKLDNVLSEKK